MNAENIDDLIIMMQRIASSDGTTDASLSIVGEALLSRYRNEMNAEQWKQLKVAVKDSERASKLVNIPEPRFYIGNW